MKLNWEKGVNHHKDAENMMKEALKYKFTPVQMIEAFILNEIKMEHDETRALFLGHVYRYENNLLNEQYNKGVDKVFSKLQEKIDELEDLFL
jgi:hypothetical protein